MKTIIIKNCLRCFEKKSEERFHIDRSRDDGRNPICKTCKKVMRHSYYLKHLELEKSRATIWNSSNKEKYNFNHRKFVESNLDYRFSVMKAHAKRRGILFEMSFQEYLPLTLLPCSYCGGELPRRGGGLDRVDSNKGYTIDNVVPCCQFCNQAKMNQTLEEFLARCKRIAEKHGLNRHLSAPDGIDRLPIQAKKTLT